MKPNTMRVARSAYYEARAHGKEPTKRQRAEIEVCMNCRADVRCCEEICDRIKAVRNRK